MEPVAGTLLVVGIGSATNDIREVRMSEPHVFINKQTQTFESLRAGLQLSPSAGRKFTALNSHIANGNVLAGELVIIGDLSTTSSTVHEAYVMAKAHEVHLALVSNNEEADSFLLDNFDLLQSMLAHASMGVGAASEGWSKHLEAIRRSLTDIEKLHAEYLRSGSPPARDRFYAERATLFAKLGTQLDSYAAYGAGLQKQGSMKRMLGISTKSYMHKGEIDGYAEKIGRVARAAKVLKRGTYIGAALDVASTALDIQKACALGREDQCKRAKYVESTSLVFGLAGGAAGGSLAGAAAAKGCLAVGIATGGTVGLVCAVVGGAIGGWGIGMLAEGVGENVGELIYESQK
jgi:hypothetical protein